MSGGASSGASSGASGGATGYKSGDASDAPGPVRAGEELPLPALNAWLAEAAPQLGAVKSVAQFPGGFSNLTYLLTTEKGEAVLRRPPLGVEGGRAHDMPREARILSVLELRGVPAPRAIATCEDPAVIGAPFYVMQRVQGLILRGSRAPKGFDAATFARLGEAFIDTLVAIHGATPSDPVIGGLGKPMGYVARQVEGWTNRWADARTDDVPVIESLARWLDEHQPGESGACLVHNDYKYDNLVLDPANPTRIVAVLDWEMATLGDPLLDIGTTLGYWMEPGDDPVFSALGLGITTLPGNATRAELWARYLERAGRAMRPRTFYEAFGTFKIAVIAQQIFARYRRGVTSDERFARLGEAVRLLGEHGARVVAQG
ncbi:MAG: phosphotransferase family protein [Gemmatimonadales bacterium]|nr:phosphotransferase family protein [Gemmatimonadales bacterium]